MNLIKVFLLSFTLSFSYAAEKTSSTVVPAKIQSLLEQYCTDCHGAKKKKGDIRLHNIADLSKDFQSNLLNKIEQEIFLENMPPDDEDQPTAAERQVLFSWLNSQYQRLGEKSKFQDKLKTPAFGNYVNHEKLFSGEYKDKPGFTADRRWLLSEFIFNDKMNRVLDHQGMRTIDGVRQKVYGDNGVSLGLKAMGGRTLRTSLTNPFLLPKNIGVRYYDNTMLTNGHLLTMIGNAKKIATHMSSEKTMKAHYPGMYSFMKMEFEHRQILQSREKFLKTYMDRVAQDIYKEKNKSFLPTFTATQITKPATHDANGKKMKKAAFHASNPGPAEMFFIYREIRKHKKEGDTDQQLIAKCEQDWFNYGIDARKAKRRIVFMNGYMEEIYQEMEKKGGNEKAKFANGLVEKIYKDGNQKTTLAPYKKLADAEMSIINTSILKNRQKGDRFNKVIAKCMNDWEQSFKAVRQAAGGVGDKGINSIVKELYSKIFERVPSAEELKLNNMLMKDYMQDMGNQQAIAKLAQTLLLNTEFVYRSEFGVGQADAHGRKMMSPRDASYAIAYALTDSKPDAKLVDAVQNGKLNTREDYKREVARMLKNRQQYYVIDEAVQKANFAPSLTNMPIRKIRFFREFFGYTKAMSIFKDNVRLGANYDSSKGSLVDEADMLVCHIMENDQKVFEELLTTEKFYIFHSGDNKAMKAYSDRIKTVYDYFKDKDWENFTEDQLYAHWPFIDKMKLRGTVFPNFLKSKRKKGWVRSFKRMMAGFTKQLSKGQKAAAPYNIIPLHYRHKGNATGRTGMVMRSEQVGKFFNVDYTNWDYPTTQPAKVPNRKGMLTHPAWLIAHAQNTETDPVIRGKWVREKLLAGTIPDVPITVEAVIPEDHHKTLRSRLVGVTEKKECWRCHKHMNPLGYTFEIYNDFGIYRTKESLEHPDNLITKATAKQPLYVDQRAVYKTLPVNAKGFLKGTGDDKLDGEVKDAIELAERLGKSSKVRQSIIRHVFRYFMGRNEVLSDSKTLIEADQVYVKSGGSFDALIVSLLSSDSFIYRKKVR
jgi:hypothetical protein